MSDSTPQIPPHLQAAGLYNEDLAPVPRAQRTWNRWHLAALWVGMAVCIPTYLMAAGMISAGIPWWAALLIIAFANLIITVPMVLNGHSGVQYGVPFPVLGRSAFGTKGIHVPALLRAFVACGWFGVQTWIGGLAIDAMWCALTGATPSAELDGGKFIGFGIFWLINLYFIWNGTESIKWLENLSAPILILTGVALIGWGTYQAGGFGTVLAQSRQLQQPAGALVEVGEGYALSMNPIRGKTGAVKADSFLIQYPLLGGNAGTLQGSLSGWDGTPQALAGADQAGLRAGSKSVELRFVGQVEGKRVVSKPATIQVSNTTVGSMIWQYLIWLTVMVGFWATMSISIADITRYASSQSDQVVGQLIGLPGTMVLYSFVGIFVTCAALVNFDDILIGNDAPWNPVDLLARFQDPAVVVVAQIFMLIATLTTNIAANVIAPANAIANLFPKQLTHRTGGLITALIGILMCPWWAIDSISPILLFVSGLLGPVLGVLLSDYYLVRRRQLDVPALFDPQGIYSFRNGWNVNAFVAMGLGMGLALIGALVPALDFLYSLSWFIGFGVAFVTHWLLMRRAWFMGRDKEI
jgi:cytosine/uracil/thiamine/allantoin permease